MIARHIRFKYFLDLSILVSFGENENSDAISKPKRKIKKVVCHWNFLYLFQKNISQKYFLLSWKIFFLIPDDGC